MGKFLTSKGGPLFDPIRDRGTKPGGILYDPLRDKTVTNKPGGALYDPVRNAVFSNGKSGGADPAVQAMYAARQAQAPGSIGNQGNMQMDPQSGKMIAMPPAGRPMGIGGMAYGVPGYTPQPDVPTGGGMPLPQGSSQVDPALQAAMAMLKVGQPAQATQAAPRAMLGSSLGYMPMRQPGNDY